MNTNLSDDYCLYRSQFGYPYPGLFNPLRCNYEYALTGSDSETGSKKQDETKKRREKKRMSQLMYSDTRRQRLNERLRQKLENRKVNEDDISKTKNQSATTSLSEQDLVNLFDTKQEKETKRKKKKKKRKKKKEKEKEEEKSFLLKEEEMQLLEEDMRGSDEVVPGKSKENAAADQDVAQRNEESKMIKEIEKMPKNKKEICLQVIDDETPAPDLTSAITEENVEDNKPLAETNVVEEEEKSCGETNSTASVENVTERGSTSVDENPESRGTTETEEFDPAWLMFMSDHEREHERDDDEGFIVVKRKEKRPKPNRKPKQYRKRIRKRRDRDAKHNRKRKQRNDDRKNEKSGRNNQTPLKHTNSCPIKHVSSTRQIFIPQQQTNAPSIPDIIQEEEEKQVKEKLNENERTPSDSETTQYFIMPIPETPQPQTHEEKCDPTLIQQDYSSPNQSASTSKSPSPTRPPPGFETTTFITQEQPIPGTVHYQQQINPHMVNFCPYQVEMEPPTEGYGINQMNPNDPTLAKPFHFQQMDSVMYLYLPSEQVLKIPMCPEERCSESKYRMNLDLSFPSPTEIPTSAYYLPIMPPVQQNGVFMYPNQINVYQNNGAEAYMVPEQNYMPFVNPDEGEMFTPIMYPMK